jgi:hypothetical protein
MIKDYIDAYEGLCEKFKNNLSNYDLLKKQPSNIARDFHNLKCLSLLALTRINFFLISALV